MRRRPAGAWATGSNGPRYDREVSRVVDEDALHLAGKTELLLARELLHERRELIELRAPLFHRPAHNVAHEALAHQLATFREGEPIPDLTLQELEGVALAPSALTRRKAIVLADAEWVVYRDAAVDANVDDKLAFLPDRSRSLSQFRRLPDRAVVVVLGLRDHRDVAKPRDELDRGPFLLRHDTLTAPGQWPRARKCPPRAVEEQRLAETVVAGDEIQPRREVQLHLGRGADILQS
jgi:hypothetical protein